MDRLQCMTSFVRVVDRGSLAAAAEGTGFTPTMIGNHIRYLEAGTGDPLVYFHGAGGLRISPALEALLERREAFVVQQESALINP